MATKKVGGSTEPKSEKNKDKKPEFDLKTATTAEGKAVPGRTEGKLDGVPYNFDPKQFRPLKASDFTSKHHYLNHKARLMELGIQSTLDKIQAMRNEAKKLEALGDDATRKKASKLMKARETIAALEAELDQDGFDLSLLDS